MCKSTFKPGSMRGFPIGDINTKLGESKEIESILQPTTEERHLLDHVVEEDDKLCAIVDGWTKRLVNEDQPVFFEQLFKDDIQARSRVPTEGESSTVVKRKAKKGESSKPVKGKGKEKVEVGGDVAEELKALQETMVNSLNAINERLESMDERLKSVESFVTFMRGPENDVIIMDMEGQTAGRGVDLLAEAAETEAAHDDGAGGSVVGGKKQKKKRKKSHGKLTKPPFKRPNTRQSRNDDDEEREE